jgi:hypothetical protein
MQRHLVTWPWASSIMMLLAYRLVAHVLAGLATTTLCSWSALQICRRNCRWRGRCHARNPSSPGHCPSQGRRQAITCPRVSRLVTQGPLTTRGLRQRAQCAGRLLQACPCLRSRQWKHGQQAGQLCSTLEVVAAIAQAIAATHAAFRGLCRQLQLPIAPGACLIPCPLTSCRRCAQRTRKGATGAVTVIIAHIYEVLTVQTQAVTGHMWCVFPYKHGQASAVLQQRPRCQRACRYHRLSWQWARRQSTFTCDMRTPALRRCQERRPGSLAASGHTARLQIEIRVGARIGRGDQEACHAASACQTYQNVRVSGSALAGAAGAARCGAGGPSARAQVCSCATCTPCCCRDLIVTLRC